MEKVLSYEEVIALARENYNNGGDIVFECWDEKFYNDYVKEFGPISKEKLLSVFSTHKSVELEAEMLFCGW